MQPFASWQRICYGNGLLLCAFYIEMRQARIVMVLQVFASLIIAALIEMANKLIHFTLFSSNFIECAFCSLFATNVVYAMKKEIYGSLTTLQQLQNMKYLQTHTYWALRWWHSVSVAFSSTRQIFVCSECIAHNTYFRSKSTEDLYKCLLLSQFFIEANGVEDNKWKNEKRMSFQCSAIRKMDSMLRHIDV